MANIVFLILLSVGVILPIHQDGSLDDFNLPEDGSVTQWGYSLIAHRSGEGQHFVDTPNGGSAFVITEDGDVYEYVVFDIDFYLLDEWEERQVERFGFVADAHNGGIDTLYLQTCAIDNSGVFVYSLGLVEQNE